MSNRCRVLVVLGLLGAGLGTLRDQETLAVLSVALLFWAFGTWAMFSIRIALLWPGLTLRRTLNGQPSERTTLWSDRSVVISVQVASSRGKLPTLCTLDDMLPESLHLRTGQKSETIVGATDCVELNYECTVLAAGVIELPGVHLQFRDPQGLFVTERFLEHSVALRCLPSFARIGDARPTVKRMNSLPQHGIHRLQRSGLGSELLELREYQPGDPPKSIAWKVSARRDHLMTRQYESEVPVRITLFVDGSDENRLGGFGFRQLDQINYLAASVARSAISAGDSLGLVLMSTKGHRRLASSFGERAFYRVLDALADFSSLPPRIPSDFTLGLQRTAVSIARRRFPELMQATVNRTPMTWLPVLPWKRRLWRERVQLAGLLGVLYRLSVKGTCEIYWDDRRFAELVRQFLWDQGWAWMSPTQGVSAATENASNDVGGQLSEAELLRDALTKSVALARDNEVFVIIANLFNRDPYVAHVLPAIKMAVARHHRVVVLCTRPFPAVPMLQQKAKSSVAQQASLEEREVLLKAQGIETDKRLGILKRQLRKVGAKVASASESNAISLVLAEAELAGRGLTVGGGGR